MNFFGGSNCGDMHKDRDYDDRGGCGCGFDTWSVVFLLLHLQNCGCGNMRGGCGISVDCSTLLLLMLLSNCNNPCK